MRTTSLIGHVFQLSFEIKSEILSSFKRLSTHLLHHKSFVFQILSHDFVADEGTLLAAATEVSTFVHAIKA